MEGQSPTPSQGPEGSDLRSVATQIEGLLDESGHVGNGAPSRAHPDYDESQHGQPRNERGQFTSSQDDGEADSDDEAQLAAQQDVDQSDDDTADPSVEDDGDTNEAADASAQDDAGDGEEGTDGDPIESLEQFAEALEVPIEDLLGQVKHTFRASGEDVTVTLSELVAGYQKDADYRQRTERFKQERRAAEAADQARMQQWQQVNYALAAQLNAVEQMLSQEAQSPQMEHLRQTDPAEWTARQQEMQRRFQTLQGARQQAMAAYQQHQHTTLTQLKEREQKALKDAVPDFGPQHHQQAWETMTSLGYTADELKQVFDHRVIVGALEMHRLRAENAELRAQKEKATETVRRVRKNVTPMAKPGKRQAKSGQAVQRDNLAKLRARAAKTGRVEDAAKVIEQFL